MSSNPNEAVTFSQLSTKEKVGVIATLAFVAMVIGVAVIFCAGFIGSDDPCYNPHVVCRGF